MNITLVLDHPDFVIVDKPIGVAVQNEADALGILPLLTKQLNINKLWLVHRLDKVTSGLLILAKNQSTAAEISQLFATRQIAKFYLAISPKKPTKKQGLIAGDMKKIRNGQWALSQSTTQPAITQFHSIGLGNGKRLFVVKPYTGKTHQIRVMCKSIGSPILGDDLYKGEQADRTYLHAFAVRFTLNGEQFDIQHPPTTGEHFCNDFMQQNLIKIASPWTLNWPKIPSSLLSKTQTVIQ